MGDLRVSPRCPNGADWSPDVSSAVGADVDGDGGDSAWSAVEEAAAQVLRAIQPTVATERKRVCIISYVQRLLSFSIGCQVFPYGSVPLKTYLPDGDIDLTVLSSPSAEDALISDIFDVIKQEEQNEHAEFEVKDVQLISAEVKLVKCLIQDIVVDISCNQLGGLCTLCFLEQIDRLVDKDHLFKRSVILIKAWCYYESRILGATHGLFSTYALEILVLYIFHIYNTSLKGPLSVLCRFLEYFSNFDWENYCVSLHGPACKSSLPDIVVHAPDAARHNLLLSKQFLTNSTSMFKVPPKDHAKQSKPFPLKFINIIDPLKDDNNLGRSVNQGNFYRIRSALKFGARKLGHILSLPMESTRKELKGFFRNTLARHGGRLQASSHPSDSSSISSFHSSDVDSSTGTRSPGAETEGTSDSSSQGSDASAYNVDRPIQAIHLSEIPLDGAKFPSNTTAEGHKMGGGESKSIDIIQEPMENTTIASNLAPSGPKLNLARVSSGEEHKSWNLIIDHNDISEPLGTFSELSGDYECHLKSLLYGQSFHGNATVLPMFLNLPVWDMHHQTNFGQDLHFPMSPNQTMWGQPFRQTRGTGTYIPRTDLGSRRGGNLPVRKARKRLQGSPTFQSYKNNNHKFNLSMVPVEENATDQMSHQTEVLESKQSPVYPTSLYAATNLSEKSEGFELSSSENLPEEKDGPDERASDDSLKSEPNLKPKALVVLIPELTLAESEDGRERVAEQSYRLKDEEDFPPLASPIPVSRSAPA